MHVTKFSYKQCIKIHLNILVALIALQSNRDTRPSQFPSSMASYSFKGISKYSKGSGS